VIWVSPFWPLWPVEQKRCLLTAKVYSHQKAGNQHRAYSHYLHNNLSFQSFDDSFLLIIYSPRVLRSSKNWKNNLTEVIAFQSTKQTHQCSNVTFVLCAILWSVLSARARAQCCYVYATERISYITHRDFMSQCPMLLNGQDLRNTTNSCANQACLRLLL
jgi:hypothetical protein